MCHYHFLLASNAKDSDEIKAKKNISYKKSSNYSKETFYLKHVFTFPQLKHFHYALGLF